jgi:hypothetical protein
MDSREFDGIIKDKLEGFSVAPSRELERKIFGFVFFQNLWVFHKLKLFASILLISTVLGVSLYNSNNASSKDSLAILEEIPLLIDDAINESNVNNRIEDKTIKSKTLVNNNQAVEEQLIDKQKTDDHIISSQESEELNILKTYDKSEDEINNKADDVKLKSSATVADDSYSEIAKTNNITPSVSSNNPLIEKNKQINNINEVDKSNKQIINLSEEQIIEVQEEKIINLSPLNITALHTCPEEINIEDVPIISVSDYANNPVKRGFSIDGYFSPYSEVDVNNVLSSAYQQYWWDFYKEYEYEKSGLAGGINISYNYNNFKINSGFNFDQVFDYKPNYTYKTEIDSIFSWNGTLLSIENISGLEVYGNDTTLILYVNPNDANLVSEINKSANRFNYLRIPLTLGYELEFNNFSLEVNGGFEYSRMVQASGVAYEDGHIDVGTFPCPYPSQCPYPNHTHTTYHYTDMIASTYHNNKEVMVFNSWNYVANAILRVRISKSLDFFSSFKYQNNKQNIFTDDYLLKKTYTRYGLNFGATYYLNPRLSFNELKTPKFD